ncbi:hypothetical protein [Sulfurisphaera tokodaii]|uniref:Uncharacterized protein n=2 Tax=Sulfurisphaera tokodaii TaxID=111955 RepID=Q96YG9_SULTO|nr:hypothetical protein [Sulfurisphaera tokodaii]BAB67308.1 hypothetical protein STK_22020 [Sulfurisphaera tokodaii str. 7]HII73064.1 hypothetical protein [Sulfurisphaera tokodaii]
MSKNSLFIIVGSVLIIIFLALYLLSPLYLPYYKIVDQTLKNNYKIVNADPNSNIKILELTTTNVNNTIYLLSNTSTVYLQIINSSGLVANNSEVLISKVYPGKYFITIDNPTNVSQKVLVRYAVFPYTQVSSLYSTLGIITTVSEFFIVLGIVALGYGVISSIFSKKRFKRKK